MGGIVNPVLRWLRVMRGIAAATPSHRPTWRGCAMAALLAEAFKVGSRLRDDVDGLV